MKYSRVCKKNCVFHCAIRGLISEECTFNSLKSVVKILFIFLFDSCRLNPYSKIQFGEGKMKNWRKLIPFSFLAVGMLMFAPAKAHDGCCNPCISCSSECCFIDDFSIAVDFLWWKPCLDDLSYATDCEEYESGDTTIYYKSLCPDWEPGVRIIFGRPCFYCDWGFVASYTYFHSMDRASVFHEGKIACPLVHQYFMTYKDELCDEVKAEWELCYQEWDALITYDMSCCNPCHLFQPFVGVAGLFLKQEVDLDIIDWESENEVKWSSDFWGVGLRAGIEYQYLFSRCLRFFTIVHGTMLAGSPENEHKQSFMIDLEIEDDDCCLFVPGYHIGVGFIYDTCICDVGVSARLGYEFTEWRNVPNHRIFCGDDKSVSGGHATSPNTRTIGFHGLLAGIGMTF